MKKTKSKICDLNYKILKKHLKIGQLLGPFSTLSHNNFSNFKKLVNLK